MKHKQFGFFDSMAKGEARRVLESLRAVTPRPDEEKILSYLSGGLQILAVMGITANYLSDERYIIGPPNVFTDGEWAWTADVVFYIERYHIEVPSDFVERMRLHDWKCPPVEKVDKLEGWQYGK